ncbi:hypothetical protein BKM31_22245 [[Actinomadura] parvosata subsp. kistnae]|uniref:Sulfotransferase domain-containing protein n=1 Tax=[Actinomadura] parvosata subsp. kistnae TaxID=1909395 RepID=A0A1V0A0U8_9ACTN|nr:sulfotransferase domain-containing protein [Nonomuraea sp. ATCC 55076]AQZ63818.1 hypothetical protein BKM31_22245 [Nonomuraea sp. ATCC 55076]
MDTPLHVRLLDPADVARRRPGHQTARPATRPPRTPPVGPRPQPRLGPSAPPAAVIDHQFHRSLYWRQLQWLLAHFPREQLLVLQYEQCVADPVAQARRTFTFLGLDPRAAPSAGELTKRVGRSYTRPDLSPATTDAFMRALAPDLARLLEEFPDLDANLWPSLRTLA